MSMTETIPTSAWASQQQSRIGCPPLFQRRPERSKSNTWPDPQRSIGTFIVKVGKDSIWEAIGPAQDAFKILAPEIKDYPQLSVEPIPCFISWSIYMLGRDVNTASPTIIFCGEVPKHRKAIRRAVKDSGILRPDFKTADMPTPPGCDQLVPLAHGKLSADIKHITVSAKLSERACGTQIFINGWTPSGLDYNKRATVGGVIKVHDQYFYTTAGHPFRAEVAEDSDALSFDGSDNDDPEISGNINANHEDANSTMHTSPPDSSRGRFPLRSTIASDHHESRPLLPTSSMDSGPILPELKSVEEDFETQPIP
ncbi:Protein png1 [Gnomoniopsis sp. IMI 355080]|nr:Protein png1 [Gnomoniopsis sp. IMI 355080]